ncbi:MAG: prepilin-type N-terminal cleavage/methylation domain-containing protein, partial [Elusimicrobiaceae bacterium]|nr:prepilin-type N-terminal cleavage/methylation domain-containing protein [Elusimicrobiaceae bacterium]
MKKAGKKIVILNLIKDLHLTDNRGFTLIELLVVVLII